MFIIHNNDIFLTRNEKIPGKGDVSLNENEILDKIDSSVWKNEDFEAVSVSDETSEKLSKILNPVPFRSFFIGATKALDGMSQKEKEETVNKASRAKSLLYWRSEQKYCSVCGGKMTEDTQFTALKCTDCERIVFPRLAPCIICLVKKYEENEDPSLPPVEKILLARNVNSTTGMYGCIAGFMEEGETAEQCVEREVMEETGIKIKNIQYAGSQSWPFPYQVMLAFYAEYESGEIKVQEEEIAEADFFTMDNLPPLPPKGTSASKLIFGEF